MDVHFNHLSQQIFNKSLEECSELEIRSFVDQHPYFSPAQFLLLKKLGKNSEAYNVQYQKAILYYHDPVAFDFLINAEEFDGDLEKDETASGEIHVNQPEVLPKSEDVIILEPKEEVTKELNTDIHQDNVEEEKTNTEHGITSQEQDHPEDLTGQEVIYGEQEILSKEEVYQDNIPEQKQKTTIIGQTTAPTELSFEPFHTVDYFASMGIKLSQEEVAKDRMGKQLKSFTEWLKTMKRLPVPEIEKSISGESEQKVENMASESVQSADVVTEAMAEVWIKQGNIVKAMEVYNKLSLYNPSKSSYFAAKIEHLKEQN